MCARLVLTLGHFLWQAAALATVAFVAVRPVRRSSAQRRYVVLVAALLVMAACPLVTFSLVHVPPEAAAVPDVAPPEQPAGPESEVPAGAGGRIEEHPIFGPTEARGPVAADGPSREVAPTADATGLVERSPSEVQESGGKEAALWTKFAPHLTLAYLVGVLLMLLRLVVGLHSGRRLRRSSQEADTDLLAVRALLSGRSSASRPFPGAGFAFRQVLETRRNFSQFLLDGCPILC